jgi:hypothetical protein
MAYLQCKIWGLEVPRARCFTNPPAAGIARVA